MRLHQAPLNSIKTVMNDLLKFWLFFSRYGTRFRYGSQVALRYFFRGYITQI